MPSTSRVRHLLLEAMHLLLEAMHLFLEAMPFAPSSFFVTRSDALVTTSLLFLPAQDSMPSGSKSTGHAGECQARTGRAVRVTATELV